MNEKELKEWGGRLEARLIVLEDRFNSLIVTANETYDKDLHTNTDEKVFYTVGFATILISLGAFAFSQYPLAIIELILAGMIIGMARTSTLKRLMRVYIQEYSGAQGSGGSR